MAYSGNYAANMEILQNGVYGKDVRQAIYELFLGHDEIIASLDYMINDLSGMIMEGGGVQNQSAEIGVAMCGVAATILNGSVSRTAVTKKF